jgi:pSer/pThr/pTyr-binding forkhead associated (FHA) protein
MRLTIEVGSWVGRTWIAAGQILRVGRDDAADVAVMHDEAMAPEHLELRVEGRGCRVRDLGSPGGTFVSGARVAHATVAHGAPIVAGRATLRVEPEGEPEGPESEAIRRISWTAAAGAPVQSLLRALRQPLFALLDAARAPDTPALLLRSGERHRSLFTGPHADRLARHGPYLVQIPPGSSLLEALIDEGWGRSHGVYFTSDAPFERVLASLQRLLFVTDEGGKEMYFRFYDPRVLRPFLPVATPAQARAIFAAPRAFFVEGAEARTLLVFTMSLSLSP